LRVGAKEARADNKRGEERRAVQCSAEEGEVVTVAV
jgi:hypothetical protein